MLRHSLGSAVLPLKFHPHSWVWQTCLEITVPRHPAKFTWQKLNIRVTWGAVGGAAEAEGGLYLKLRVKHKEVKGRYLSDDPTYAPWERRIVLPGNASPLSPFWPWQLKHPGEGYIRKKDDTPWPLPWSSLPGATVTLLGHSRWSKWGMV